MNIKTSTPQNSPTHSDPAGQEHILREMLDLDPNPLLIISHKAIIYGNAAACSLLGLRRNDLMNTSISRFFPRIQPDGKVSDQAFDDGMLSATRGIPWSGEFLLTVSDKRTVEVGITLRHMESAGEELIGVMITDLAQSRRQQEEAGKIRLEAEKKVQIKEGVIAYLNTELERLANNIQKLGEGDLLLDYHVSDPDEHTRTASLKFIGISSDLKKAVDAINLMMEDVMMLSESAILGVLETRADISKHKGDYTLVIQGINETLDAILQPLLEGIRICSEYSRRNFDTEFNPVIPLSGEFSDFKNSLNIIGEEISGMIQSLKNEIAALSQHADNAITGVEDVSRGAQEIAKNAQETSLNAEKAEMGIQQVLQSLSDLTMVVSDISRDSETVSRLSATAKDQALKGTNLAGSTEKGMNSITISTAEVEQNIFEIRNEMKQIRKIVSIITDLANQTNLLALNAAIEAARAGDAGRGFAVVAAEVKSLAQESRSSAESINEMIMGLEKKSDAAATAIEAAGSAVKEGNSALSDTLAIFKDLTRSVVNINEKMLNIAEATEQQAGSFEEITASAHEMSALVKVTADDATHSSATAEEALAIVSQITSIIDLINNAVSTMETEMKSFKIRQ